MVSISQDLNDDLDDYLSRKRGRGGWHFFGGSPKPTTQAKPLQDLPEDQSKVVGEEPGFWKRMFGASKKEEMVSEDLTPDEMARLEGMEHKIERLDEAEKEYPEAAPQFEAEKESLVSRFFGMFRGYEHRHELDKKMGQLEVYEAEQAAKDEEVKKVLRVMHKWLEQLSPEEKNAFRRSSDFQEYKALLEKYGLARPKQPEPPKGPVRNTPDR